MPQMATIVLKDAFPGTPNSHYFDPSFIRGDTSEWTDRSPVVTAGYRRLTAKFRPGTLANSGYKLTLRLVDPTLAVTAPSTSTGIQPNPTVAYSNFVELTVGTANAANAQTKKDLVAYLQSLVFEPQFVDWVEKSSGTY